MSSFNSARISLQRMTGSGRPERDRRQAGLPPEAGIAFGVLGLLCLALVTSSCSSTTPPVATGGTSGSGGTAGKGGAGGDGVGGNAGGGTGGTSGCGPLAGGGGMAGGTFVEPKRLSETGLYKDIKKKSELAPCVERYEPEFLLWSDGAGKIRYIYLPPGSRIDTSDMDYWRFPVGTKIWKEFWREKQGSMVNCNVPDPSGVPGCVHVETRLLQKISDAGSFWYERWFRRAFQWLEDGTDAVITPDTAEQEEAGVKDALGTSHDIPSKKACVDCHFTLSEALPGDVILGFSAIQLSHSQPGLNLTEIVKRGWLTHPPTAPFILPGSLDQQKALGHLHANCGNCHNARATGIQATVNMQFWLSTQKLGSVQETPSYLTTVGAKNTSQPLDECPDYRIISKKPAESSVLCRMKLSPQHQRHMPPVAVEEHDKDEGLIENFINSLD